MSPKTCSWEFEVVRGFANLEETLDQYFSPKVIEDGSGLRVKTARKFRKMPGEPSSAQPPHAASCCLITF